MAYLERDLAGMSWGGGGDRGREEKLIRFGTR